MSNENRKFTTISEAIDHQVVFVGGTTAVTKVADTGPGITVTYAGTGLVDLSWTDAIGTFVGFAPGFQATAPAAVKGYTMQAGVPSTSTAGVTTLRLNIHSSAFSLVDLAALQWAHVLLTFKRSGTGV